SGRTTSTRGSPAPAGAEPSWPARAVRTEDRSSSTVGGPRNGGAAGDGARTAGCRGAGSLATVGRVQAASRPTRTPPKVLTAAPAAVNAPTASAATTTARVASGTAGAPPVLR